MLLDLVQAGVGFVLVLAFRKFVAPGKRGRIDAQNEGNLRRVAGLDFKDADTRVHRLSCAASARRLTAVRNRGLDAARGAGPRLVRALLHHGPALFLLQPRGLRMLVLDDATKY
ncbi:MAG TPA: hypothetical protein VF598_09605 [Hymenobacter sp.]|jgi:hypothetical protein